jgi:arabinofuranan 3-O-arabinosyltransferase
MTPAPRSHPAFRLARLLFSEPARYVAAWLLALGVAAMVLHYAWTRYSNPRRPDGDHGHRIIDFGGQWIAGRMIVEGQGPHLYDRSHIRTVLVANYPWCDQDMESPETDTEFLMSCFVYDDGRDAPPAAASLATPLAAADPLQLTVLLAAGQHCWTKERLDTITARRRDGPIYPPTHALLWAPLALMRPLTAYRFMQVLNLVLAFVAGLGLSRLTGGRLWWPLAACLVMLFPGFASSIRYGQNATITLALLVLGWWLLARGRPVAAGALWALFAFKPVWGVAFFPVLLVTHRWRAAAATLAVAGLLALATLPLVGLDAWRDWFTLGREAGELYSYYAGWVRMSRDLYNLPLRWLLEFTDDGGTHDPDPARTRAVSLGLWLGVTGITFLTAAWRWRHDTPLTGPAAAFLLLGAWLSAYHFMFYDVLPAALPVALLLVNGMGPSPPAAAWPPRPLWRRLARGLWDRLPVVLLLPPLMVLTNVLSGVPPWLNYQEWLDAAGVPPELAVGELNARFGDRARWLPPDTAVFLFFWAWYGVRCLPARRWAGLPAAKEAGWK